MFISRRSNVPETKDKRGKSGKKRGGGGGIGRRKSASILIGIVLAYRKTKAVM